MTDMELRDAESHESHNLPWNPPMQPVAEKRFGCTVAGCTKRFHRREHLNRHLKSHEPSLQYECHICGRRYARSDVLKRHVEYHPSSARPARSIRRSMPSSGQASVEEGICSDNGSEHKMSDGWRGDDVITMPQAVDSLIHGQQWFQHDQRYTSSLLQLSTGIETPLSVQDDARREWAADPTLTYPQYLPQALVIDHSEGTASSNQALTPAISDDQTSRENFIAQIPVIRNSTVVKRLIAAFFDQVHPIWPILHAPSFNLENHTIPDTLIITMIMLASLIEGSDEYISLTSSTLAQINNTLHLEPSLHDLQAALLFNAYATCHLTTEDIKLGVLKLHGRLVMTCRYLGVFTGQFEPSGFDEQEPWLFREQSNRLAFAILRIDTYLSVLLDHPPLVRYQEFLIPFTKTEALWEAQDEERQRLRWSEPSGREKALLCFVMRDALDSQCRNDPGYPLTGTDYHHGLCAMQSGTWEAAREAHSAASDELTTRKDQDKRVGLWRSRLHSWRERMERDIQLRRHYFHDPTFNQSLGSDLSSFTLILLHLSTLRMHAPLNILRLERYFWKSRPGGVVPSKSPVPHLRTWLASRCPRIAVWNAAQIARVFVMELSMAKNARVSLNPLAIPGLLISAVVVCSYAFNSRVCPTCTGNSEPVDLVDLFNADDDCPHLKTWLEGGPGLGAWGGDLLFTKMPVCHCSVLILATWFCKLLACDSNAESEFNSLLADIIKQ